MIAMTTYKFIRTFTAGNLKGLTHEDTLSNESRRQTPRKQGARKNSHGPRSFFLDVARAIGHSIFMSNAQQLETVRNEIKAAELAFRSERYMNKLWKKLFAIEDAIKLSGAWS